MIVLSPPSPSVATGQALQLSFYVDSADWESQFNTLEVWRSRLGEGGPYELLTGDAWAPARLPANVSGSSSGSGPSVNIVGLGLLLRVGERTDLSYTFTGTNPLTYAQAATQIAAGSSGLLSSFNVVNHLVVETRQPGAGAVLRCLGGDAAPLLGLATAEPESVAFGKDARIPLIHGTSLYTFSDLNGSSTFYYKTRFFNSASRVASEYSLPVAGKPLAAIAPSNLIKAFADFVNMSGVAAANQDVLVHCLFGGVQIEGKTVLGGPLRLVADADGHVEFMLVRGARVTISVPGTNLVRDINVPTDANLQQFDLFDPAVGADDLFRVQTAQQVFAARRSY